MSDQTQKPVVPDEMPPEAPAELHAKRETLMTQLESDAKTSSGTVQQSLRVMVQLLNSCRPGGTMEPELDASIRRVFQQLEKEGVTEWPPSLMSSVQWMQDYLVARGLPRSEGGAEVGANVPGAGSKDVFERAQSKMSLTGEQAPPAVTGNAPQEGGVKNWQLNPGLGKVRG
ncbi:MAG TPA: hypothetical protein VK013_07115 [Myxococcaceae bacterium]|nr:hypothetical protein [Myxococcaceae bacterium]